MSKIIKIIKSFFISDHYDPVQEMTDLFIKDAEVAIEKSREIRRKKLH